MIDPRKTRGAFGRMTTAVTGPGIIMTNPIEEALLK
jgi:hypothetical protein